MSIGSYDYDGLCEAFIKQSQPEGKTAGGRLWFNKLDLYSYNSHLATLDPVNNVLLVDSYIKNYSRTTQRQANVLGNYAGNLTVYKVNLNSKPSEQIKSYWSNIDYLFGRYNKARVTKNGYKSAIIETYKEAVAYISYVKFDKRTKEYKLAIRNKDYYFAKLLEHKFL